MGSEVESDTELDLTVEGVGLSLNSFNPYSPRQLRFRMDSDPSYGYKRLRLTGEELVKPPATIWKIKELEFLDMSPGPQCDTCTDFQLERLPSDVYKLINLRVLSLDTNKLEEIPPEVGLLSSLERLVLSNNQLTDLPKSLKACDKLCSLHLANNYFKDVPKVVYSLASLQFLDVSDNKISQISPDIGNLANLESLLLMCNQLESIPDSIGECVNMKTLWLGMNRITELPRSIGQLYDLDWAQGAASANLDGNPLKEPPMEICKKGPLIIEEYFRNKEMMVMIMTNYDIKMNDQGGPEHGSKVGFAPDIMNSRASSRKASRKDRYSPAEASNLRPDSKALPNGADSRLSTALPSKSRPTSTAFSNGADSRLSTALPGPQKSRLGSTALPDAADSRLALSTALPIVDKSRLGSTAVPSYGTDSRLSTALPIANQSRPGSTALQGPGADSGISATLGQSVANKSRHESTALPNEAESRLSTARNKSRSSSIAISRNGIPINNVRNNAWGSPVASPDYTYNGRNSRKLDPNNNLNNAPKIPWKPPVASPSDNTRSSRKNDHNDKMPMIPAWGSPAVSPGASSNGRNSRKFILNNTMPRIPSRAMSVPASFYFNSVSPLLKSESNSRSPSRRSQRISPIKNNLRSQDQRNSAPVSKVSKLPDITTDGLGSYLSERPRSKYSDYVKRKAWERWQQLAETLPTTADARYNRVPSSYQDLTSSATSELLKLLKSATPRYDFSFNNSRDIQILRLHESPNKNQDKADPLFTKSPRAPNVPKPPETQVNRRSASNIKSPRSSIRNSYEENDEHENGEAEEAEDDTTEERTGSHEKDLSDSEAAEIPSTADLMRRLQRLKQDQEQQRAAMRARKDGSRPVSKRSISKAESDKDDRLPMIVTKSNANSPMPKTPNQARAESINANEASRPNTNQSATPTTSSVPSLPPARRRGYVVEKRTLMKGYRKRRKSGNNSGRSSKSRQNTPGVNANLIPHEDEGKEQNKVANEEKEWQDEEENRDGEDESRDIDREEVDVENSGKGIDKERHDGEKAEDKGTGEDRKRVKGNSRKPSRAGSVARSLYGPKSGKSTRNSSRLSSSRAVKSGPKIAFGQIVPEKNDTLKSPSRGQSRKSRRSNQSRSESRKNTPSLTDDFWSVYRNAPKVNLVTPSSDGVPTRGSTRNSIRGSVTPGKSPVVGKINNGIRTCEHISNMSNKDRTTKYWSPSPALNNKENNEPSLPNTSRIGQMIRSDSQTSESSDDKVVKKRRKRKPKSPVAISRNDEFQAARELFGPVLCRDCELKHLIQEYQDSIKSLED